MNKYRKTKDGWFDFYVNIETGKKKFNLENGDVEVDCFGNIICVAKGDKDNEANGKKIKKVGKNRI